MSLGAPFFIEQLTMKLIDNWKLELRRLWSSHIAIFSVVFWSTVSGLIAVWPAFADVAPLWVYALIGVVLSVAFGVARFLKQPGASDE